ncbi:hypothetical protein GBAR_LOCUS9955 [Geodia barretti]|uniref:Uncharacterized protein n=1 Tax=Geodia barretti TaxID=519541 RepID=A0AA35RTP8_GEOBA|nr:hypothetical protein GBAR_LOCUS9955 [Geodia barretti]
MLYTKIPTNIYSTYINMLRCIALTIALVRLVWIYPIPKVRNGMRTWLCVLVPVHQTAHLPHHRVEGLWLVGVHVVPRPPHVVDLYVGVRSEFLDPLTRTAVHPRPRSVHKRQWNRGREVWWSDPFDHWSFRPTNWDLHVVERISPLEMEMRKATVILLLLFRLNHAACY